jgi:hypothetical protein
MAMLAAETSAREVAVVWDSTTLLVKHVEDRATVEEGEALERVSRAEAKNVLRWPMLMRVPKASSRSSPSSRTSLRWRVRAGRCLTESTEHNLRSSPFCRPGALSCAILSSVHHGARHHLSEGMRLAQLHQTEVAREFAALQTVVSSTTESLLGCLPGGTFRVEVVAKLTTEFQKMEDRCSWVERPAVRICDLLPAPPPGRAQLADGLDEAIG